MTNSGNDTLAVVTDEMVRRAALALVKDHTSGAVAVDHDVWEACQRVARLVLTTALEDEA